MMKKNEFKNGKLLLFNYKNKKCLYIASIWKFPSEEFIINDYFNIYVKNKNEIKICYICELIGNYYNFKINAQNIYIINYLKNLQIKDKESDIFYLKLKINKCIYIQINKLDSLLF